MRNMFRKISPERMARDELEQARRELLQAETMAEFWEAQAVYNRQRISRLVAVVRGHDDDFEEERVAKIPPMPLRPVPAANGSFED